MLITDLSAFVVETSSGDLSAESSRGHQSHLAGGDSGSLSPTVKSLMNVTESEAHVSRILSPKENKSNAVRLLGATKVGASRSVLGVMFLLLFTAGCDRPSFPPLPGRCRPAPLFQ